MDDEPALQIQDLTKRYEDTVALDDVTLQVGRGTVHAVVGPNGAGKTTLLAVMFGLVHPGAGIVRILGRTQAEGGAQWLRGVGGFVESPRFYPYFTGLENLGLLAALDGPASQAEVDDALELVGLAMAAHKRVRGYSLGMRQRLGVAAALLRHPRLLIVDEPTNGMDPAGIRDLLGALRAFADAGMTVVMSSHHMSQVEEIADSVTVLSRGRVVFGGALDSMRAAAPKPSWQMHTSDDSAAERYAKDIPDLAVVAGAGSGLEVVATQATLDAFVIQLGRQEVAVRGLSLTATALESAYFLLTGQDVVSLAPSLLQSASGTR